MSEILVSVFTPTYNRSKLLTRLYNSLQKQTCLEFEWIIVDDGSTDNTETVVNDMKTKSLFPIKYYKQKNSGKHVAINKGVEVAKGRMFFVVDSDDYLTKDAIAEIVRIDESIIDKKGYCGLSGVRVDLKGKLIGKTFSQKFIDCTALERAKYRILGDKSEVYYTDVLKKYPFPVFNGENFITEYVVWYRMAKDGYKIRWTNEPFYVCDYQNTGLSATTGKCSKNFKGFQLTTKEYLTYKQLPVVDRIKQLIAYSGICRKEKKDLKECAMAINQPYLLVKYLSYAGYYGYRIKRLIKRR